MTRHAAILVLTAPFTFLLGACTTIGHQKVEGWPKLTVVEHYVPHYQMRDVCVKYTGFGMSPEACAEFNLVERRCDLWFSADFPPPPAFVKHERMHCEGYDHVGETNMRDFLRAYLEQQPRTASVTQSAPQ